MAHMDDHQRWMDPDEADKPKLARPSTYVLAAVLGLLIAVPLAVAIHGEDNRGLFDQCDNWLCETLR